MATLIETILDCIERYVEMAEGDSFSAKAFLALGMIELMDQIQKDGFQLLDYDVRRYQAFRTRLFAATEKGRQDARQ